MTGPNTVHHTAAKTVCPDHARGGRTLTFEPSPVPDKPTTNGTYPSPNGVEYDRLPAAELMTSVGSQGDLARWLLKKETGADSSAVAVSDGAERVCQKLSSGLARLVSPVGAQAMLARALYLVRPEFPFLTGVTAGQTPEPCFEGLAERVHDVDADELDEALLAVVGSLLHLFVGFIGEDLTLRLTREIWSDLPMIEPSQTDSSNGHGATS